MDLSKTTAERLLAAMHPTCSHDLPNQILSLQSLVNLIEMDEVDHLGAAGQEYMRRLKAVADKTAVMSDFLKAMVRLIRYEPRPRSIAIADVIRELKAEARNAFETPPHWDDGILAGAMWADYDLVYPSLVDLLRCMTQTIEPTVEKSVSIASTSRSRLSNVELVVRGRGLQKLTTMLPERGDFLLAQERLYAAGVELKFGPPRVDEASVVMEFAAERP